MLAHRLRHRIEIQERAEFQNPTTGEITVQWQTVYLDSNTPLDSVPAEVLTGPGREAIASGTTQSVEEARVNIRWFPGLSPKWRILWDGKIYGIDSIETDATARREYRLKCTRDASEGE